MTTETASTTIAAPAAPSAADAAATAALTEQNRIIDQDDASDELTEEQKAEAAAKAKPEKTPEQREIERLRRGIDRKHRQLAEARAQLGLTRQPIQPDNRSSSDDSEPVSLTRAELREMVNAEAEKLAPTLHKQLTETQQRKVLIDGLSKAWGKERFDELSEELDAAFDGLADATGNAKPAFKALFEAADDPAMVIEYLANPEHDDEAEAISRMSEAKAGAAIKALELRLAAAKAEAKPQASKLPAPLEPVRGPGPVKKALADLDGKDFDKRRREQIAARR